jgi:hypothetical protein
MIRLDNPVYPRATTHLASDKSGTEGSNPAPSANESLVRARAREAVAGSATRASENPFLLHGGTLAKPADTGELSRHGYCGCAKGDRSQFSTKPIALISTRSGGASSM